MARSFNTFTEFPNLGIQKVKEYETIFKQHDKNEKGYLDLEDCKKVMEFVGKPQTHLGLKRLIKQASENEPVQMNPPNTLSLYGFLSIFDRVDEDDSKELDVSLSNDTSKQENVNVAEKGVSGAKNFFAQKINQQAKSNKAEDEIKAAQAARKVRAQETASRKSTFKDRINMFNTGNDWLDFTSVSSVFWKVT